ncbi:MAG: hypothetical protein ACRDB2_08255 [Fusobacteriaceae bacterium]
MIKIDERLAKIICCNLEYYKNCLGDFRYKYLKKWWKDNKRDIVHASRRTINLYNEDVEILNSIPLNDNIKNDADKIRFLIRLGNYAFQNSLIESEMHFIYSSIPEGAKYVKDQKKGV